MALLYRDPVTDKFVSYEQVEMFSHQMTQQTLPKNVSTLSGADHPYDNIDPLTQKLAV